MLYKKLLISAIEQIGVPERAPKAASKTGPKASLDAQMEGPPAIATFLKEI